MDSNAWIAVGTFVGPLAAGVVVAILAVWFGARRFSEEQEGRDARRYLLEEGGYALKSALDSWLELSRRNYALGQLLINTASKSPQGNPLALDPDAIPSFLPQPEHSFRFDAIAPASRLTGCLKLADATTKAMAEIYSSNLIWELTIRQPIVRFYRGDHNWEGMSKEWPAEFRQALHEQWLQVERYAPLSVYLGDAVLRAQELRLGRMNDMERIQGDPTMRHIAESIEKLAMEVTSAPQPDKSTTAQSGS